MYDTNFERNKHNPLLSCRLDPVAPPKRMDGDGDDDNDSSIDIDALCNRFLISWEVDESVQSLVSIAEEYAGDSGHLLLHPNDNIARALFAGTGHPAQNNEDLVHRKRLDFFRCLLSLRPQLQTLQSPESGITLLHLALYQFAALPLIELLACRQLMSYRDSSGRTPIYLACYRSQPGVKEFLFDLDPAAVRIVDNDGQLPLHLACQQDPLDPFVDKLIREYPEALRHKHSKGVTPVLGAFWHQHQQQVVNDPLVARRSKLNRLTEWVELYPESVRAFNASNMETALACACRQLYDNGNSNSNGDEGPDRTEEGDNLPLCRRLIEEYPVALAMTVSMTLALRRHATLPYPLQIARHYRRGDQLVRELERATMRLARAFVELVLHGTFSAASSSSSSGPHMRLQRHVRNAIELHCPFIDLRRCRSHDGGGSGGSAANRGPQSSAISSLAVAEMVVKQQALEEEGFPEALCTCLFRNYDARFVLKTDDPFRDALCALFRMIQQGEDRTLLLFPAITAEAAATVSNKSSLRGHVIILAAGSDDVTALFLRVREFFPSFFATKVEPTKRKLPT